MGVVGLIDDISTRPVVTYIYMRRLEIEQFVEDARLDRDEDQ